MTQPRNPLPPTSRGLDRRALIKRAAAAGAAAWTAPVIINSLASPAAALSVACGCYKAVISADDCTLDLASNNDCSPAPPSGTCPGGIVPQNDVAKDYVASDFCLSLVASNVDPPSGCTLPLSRYVTITIGADCDCVIAAAQAKVVGRGGCEDPRPGFVSGDKTVNFDKGNATETWKSFTLIIKCC